MALCKYEEVKFILSPDYDKIIGEFDNNQELYEFKESNYDREIIINDKYQASLDKVAKFGNILGIYEEHFILENEEHFVDEFNDYLNEKYDYERQGKSL